MKDDDFTRVAESLWPRLVRTAATIVGASPAAEDLAQDALRKLYAARHKVADTDAACGYAYRTLVRDSRRFRRREGRRMKIEATFAGPTTDDSSHADIVDVRDAIANLGPRQREALVLHYYLDLSIADMAGVMGCSASTAKTHLSRAREHLCAALAPESNMVAQSEQLAMKVTRRA